MPRLPRAVLPDGYFHVFARGIASSEPLFRDDADRRIFLDILWRTAMRHDWTCYAICLLSTHYHLVVSTTRVGLSAGAQRLNWLYARHVNARHDRFGHVFSDRFGARAIGGEDYLYDACEYVLQNPVKAGLCDRADEWPWSYSAFSRRTSSARAQSSAG